VWWKCGGWPREARQCCCGCSGVCFCFLVAVERMREGRKRVEPIKKKGWRAFSISATTRACARRRRAGRGERTSTSKTRAEVVAAQPRCKGVSHQPLLAARSAGDKEGWGLGRRDPGGCMTVATGNIVATGLLP